MKKNQSGRSMIEMLGVLAIIGVLSVGGIAGFSKAMFTYRWNKSLVEWNALVSAVTKYNYQLRINDGSKDVFSLLPILEATGDLPDTMMAKNRQNKNCESSEDNCFVLDSLGNEIMVYHHNTGYIGIRSDNNGYETCRLFFNIAKTNHSTLDAVEFYISQPEYVFYGDGLCLKHAETNCVKDLTVSKINEICKRNKIVSGQGIFLMYWFNF